MNLLTGIAERPFTVAPKRQPRPEPADTAGSRHQRSGGAGGSNRRRCAVVSIDVTTRMVALTVMVASLASAGSSSPTAPTIPLERQFTLMPGERVRVADTSISVQFERVDGDSRCPADAICILGGDAQVRISVHDDGRATIPLHTGDLAPVRHDGLTIALVELAPYPFSARPIAPTDYRVTLRVSR